MVAKWVWGFPCLAFTSMIDSPIDGYSYLSASRAYRSDHALQNWAINGYMLMWREYFPEDQEGEDSTDVDL